MKLLPIVEGHGDLRAVPILIKRILQERKIYDVQVLAAHRRGEYPSIITNFENLYRAALKEGAAILWVMDFDCKTCICPDEEASKLYLRADAIRPSWPFKVAFIVKEYESLFLADEHATRTVLDRITPKTTFPANPESIRGAKEWLSTAQPKGYAYKETLHQDKITQYLNLEHLRLNSPSFAHFERAVIHLSRASLP